MGKQKTLVLTATKEFWPRPETPAVFLGPWCFANSPKFYEQRSLAMIPNPWEPIEKTKDATEYLEALLDRIYPDLQKHLELHTGHRRSKRAFQALTGVWLVHFLNVCYDRYLRLKNANDLGEKLVCQVVNQAPPDVFEYKEFSIVSEKDSYNLILLSDMLRELKFSNLELIEGRCEFKELDSHWMCRQDRGLKGRIWEFLESFGNRQQVHLGSVYGMSTLQKLIYYFRFDPFFILRERFKKPEILPTNRITTPFLFEAQNEFEAVVAKLIFRYLPISFYSKVKFYNVPKVWVGNDYFSTYQYVLSISEVLNRGGKWISPQHGCGYGQFLSFPIGKVELQVPDEFLTWGWNWEEKPNCKLTPLASPYLSELSKLKVRPADGILLVTGADSLYTYRLHSTKTSHQELDYLLERRAFLEALSKHLRTQLQWIPYPVDRGTMEKDFFKRVLDPSSIVTGKAREKMLQTRLLVVDHLGTSFLEGLACNRPTIGFWRTDQYRVSVQAQPFFSELKNVGILHESGVEAAKTVERVYSETETWWRSEEVQKARKAFCLKFGLTSANWRKEWWTYLVHQIEVTPSVNS